MKKKSKNNSKIIAVVISVILLVVLVIVSFNSNRYERAQFDAKISNLNEIAIELKNCTLDDIKESKLEVKSIKLIHFKQYEKIVYFLYNNKCIEKDQIKLMLREHLTSTKKYIAIIEKNIQYNYGEDTKEGGNTKNYFLENNEIEELKNIYELESQLEHLNNNIDEAYAMVFLVPYFNSLEQKIEQRQRELI